ncbi:hypothetical protein ACJMK2_001809 [Sinanodonta woodiana]|uniref:OTU domain-containing protein n=1 Tax=Sinanodonta woodiana TaxID=1069815 RepID=A0ABD3XUZ5_SINWO
MVKGKSKKQFPCGDLRKLVRRAVCDSWFHSTCEVITSEDFKTLSFIDEGYICHQCRSIGGKCDYLMGITRLQKREGLLSDERYCPCIYAEHSSLPVDEIAADILLRLHAEKEIPLRITGDGDCLFNAVSILLCGNESMSTELRYKTTLIMVLEESVILGHPNRSSIHLLSPDYSDVALNYAQIGSFSLAWTMIALAMVTKRLLHLSSCPRDKGLGILNTTFNHAAEGMTISVMWSNLTNTDIPPPPPA